MFVEEEIKKFNHAYMPGKGTITALAQLVKEVTNYKYIYEFDIKGFFNNVQISEVKRLLKERGMPNSMLSKLEKILISIPLNLDTNAKSAYDKYLVNSRTFMEIMGFPYEHKGAIPENWDQAADQYKRGSGNFIASMLDLDKTLPDLGLPQGAAPSTILSLTTLIEWHKELQVKGVNLLMYADDGILYSDEKFDIEMEKIWKQDKVKPPKGYEFAPEKSR